MELSKITKNKLEAGCKFALKNEDESLSAELSYGKSLGNQYHFKIWFNGVFIEMKKTFPAFFKQVARVIREYDLVAIEELPPDEDSDFVLISEKIKIYVSHWNDDYIPYIDFALNCLAIYINSHCGTSINRKRITDSINHFIKAKQHIVLGRHDHDMFVREDWVGIDEFPNSESGILFELNVMADADYHIYHYPIKKQNERLIN